MSEDNKDAVVSSLMVGVAFAVFVMVVLFFGGSPYVRCLGALAFVVGCAVGLVTTWGFDDDTDCNA